MNECQFCRAPLAAGARVCSRCGQAQLTSGRYHLVISLPLIGLALAVGLAYWVLSDLIWLPAARTIFYMLAEWFGIAYRTGELPSQSMVNAPWLLAGALVYVVFIPVVITRYGFRRALMTALLAPAPFALIDSWTWSAAQRPGLVQLAAIALASITLMLLLNAAFLFLAARWPARLALVEVHRLSVSRPAASRPAPALEQPARPARPEPAKRPVLPDREKADIDRTERLPELVRGSGVKESVPPALKAAAEEGDVAPPAGTIQPWVIVVGLAILLIIGVILVIVALRA
jgi:hypothetical protein